VCRVLRRRREETTFHGAFACIEGEKKQHAREHFRVLRERRNNKVCCDSKKKKEESSWEKEKNLQSLCFCMSSEENLIKQQCTFDNCLEQRANLRDGLS
jgi:hypothetical protein